MSRFVIIDSSYYNFYRFTATLSWYNYSPERREQAENVAWMDNPIFLKTYTKMWFETIKKLCKLFKITQSQLLFARDGNRAWRYDVYSEYKATRKITDDIHSPGPVFRYTNTELFPQLTGAQYIRVDRAEGDDVAAVMVKYIQNNNPDADIIIITGDHDFLQLSKPGRVDIHTLKGFKNITVENGKQTIMQKILAGDPSDNIPAAYKGCGKITAKKLAADPEALKQALEKHGRKQFDLNRLLIDFDNIPDDVVEEIESQLDNLKI